MTGPEKTTREQAKELTRQLILDHSKREFLEHGYLNVSVRSLAKSANLTSGAIYTHFRDKAELFECLVRPALLELKALLTEDHEERMGRLGHKGPPPSPGMSLAGLKMLVEKIYGRFSEFRLLVASSAGSGQENFLKNLSDYYSDCAKAYLAALRSSGQHKAKADPELIRMVSFAFFSAVFEVVALNLPRERAEALTAPLHKFFEPGWEGLAS
jgi:AcrR family transcriptional regulator